MRFTASSLALGGFDFPAPATAVRGVAQGVVTGGPQRFVRFGMSWPVRPFVGWLSGRPSVRDPTPTAALEAGGGVTDSEATSSVVSGLPGHDGGECAVGQRRVQLSERDRKLLAWCGEQYTVRFDLLAVLMAMMSDDPSARARGRVSRQAVSRRVRAWKQMGLAKAGTLLANEPATLWLTADGMTAAGLPWRPYEPTVVTVAHRHAVGLVRAEADAMGVGWICERELREGLGGRPLHLPDGVVLSTDAGGRTWRTAIEVELTRKTELRVAAILRQLLAQYDDVVYRATPSAATVVERAASELRGDAPQRVHVRSYPPRTLAEVA